MEMAAVFSAAAVVDVMMDAVTTAVFGLSCFFSSAAAVPALA